MTELPGAPTNIFTQGSMLPKTALKFTWPKTTEKAKDGEFFLKAYYSACAPRPAAPAPPGNGLQGRLWASQACGLGVCRWTRSPGGQKGR